ncbi:RNA-binding domain-containing protein, partial [Dissoconium aciculare CBS 342.82]|uniref:RNA-binding domain-containing protein n=1 Tax=Dissoconium aciculare CBS 342.82 TaxID=1314786 RepID=A0A6J3M1Y7_9PEZI
GDHGFSHGSFQSVHPGLGGFADRHAARASISNIDTSRLSHAAYNNSDLQTPQTGYDLNYTPLLPSQLLMGSPFQAGSPATFQSPQFQSLSSFPQSGAQRMQQQQQLGNVYQQQQAALSPTYPTMASPTFAGTPSFFGGLQSPTVGFNPLSAGNVGSYGASMMTPGVAAGTSRTVYLGNIPPDTSAEEILSHVRSGQIESVRILPEKNCTFISFLDGSSATHFHSDAILKKLSIKGQDIKIGWGKPSSVPTSVALAVQQSGASRNVYLGNLPEETTEEDLREELSKFGPIDTVKIVREKAIGFVHFLSIGNAIKAVTQLPQEPNWQAPRRVYYGKDRCAYVSKTQQQNAAQYLGIAPGYAHVLNGADRDLITNALAQQSVAAAAVATTAGGVNNLGNRTVYLGNIHPETTIEEICNVVRGGLLHHIRYIPDKHICFVTFIDPTSAASFYALSNLQGLMIHNRRLKIGWGKHSGALPPAISLAVSGGASRNVYVGNLDESWTEERLRQDFQEYGEIELVNTLREKSCAFVNFTNIANAIKAIEAVRGKEEYKRFKVNFGKDRCGNPPRQMMNNQQMQQQQQQQQNGHDNSLGSPSPVNGLGPNRNQNSISPASSAPGNAQNGHFNPLHGPTASTIFNSGSNNPLTMYLAATQQNAQALAEQQQQSEMSASGSLYSSQQPQQMSSSSNGTHLNGSSSNNSNNHSSTLGGYNSSQNNGGINGTSSSSRGGVNSLGGNQHSRTVSLPAFSLQQAQFNQQQQQLQQHGGFVGLGGGLVGGAFSSGLGAYGLGMTEGAAGAGGLPGWAEEEV